MQEIDTASEERTPLVVEIAAADWATADDVRRHQFALGEPGYDTEEVREYLGKLGDLIASLTGQLSQLRKQAAPEVTALASRMVDMLREAEAHANRLREDAEREAQHISAQAEADTEVRLRAAREEADRVRSEAQLEAERVRSEVEGGASQAATEAQRTLAEATAMRKAVELELDRFTNRLAAIAGGSAGGSAAAGDGESPDIWSPVGAPQIGPVLPESPPVPVVLEQPESPSR